MTEIQKLRVSIARIAQTIGHLKHEVTPLDGMSYPELCRLAEKDYGWNTLCAEVVENIEYLQQENAEYRFNGLADGGHIG